MDHYGSFMPVWIINAALSMVAAIISFKLDER
jgi:hypothetical protein